MSSFYIILSLVLLLFVAIAAWYVARIAKETEKQDLEARRRLEATEISANTEKELH